MKRIIVLNYHQLQTRPDGLFTVAPEEFWWQMNWLKSQGIPVISLDCLPGESTEEFGVAITFDDGNLSDYTVALPVLHELKLHASFFPTLNSTGREKYLSWDQLRELSNLGHSIGTHGISHQALDEVPGHIQVIELKSSKNIMEDKLGCAVRSFSLPFGAYNREIIQHARDAGYRYLLTTRLRTNEMHANTFLVHRWNIRRAHTRQQFSEMLSHKGHLPSSVQIASGLKYFARKVLGNGLSMQLDKLINGNGL